MRTSSVEKALNNNKALGQSNADNYINSDPDRLINEEKRFASTNLKPQTPSEPPHTSTLLISDLINRRKGVTYKPTDKPTDYLNFQVKNVSKIPTPWLSHRLGIFQCIGYSSLTEAMPTVGVLHVIGNTTGTAKYWANWMATSSPNSAHGVVDEASYVLSQPFDTGVVAAANANINKVAIQFELTGTGKEGDKYWESSLAQSKYRQTALCVANGLRLAFGDAWLLAMPPLQKAIFTKVGDVIVPGWTQHREVPHGDYKQLPDKNNQAYGNHEDITEKFPFRMFFSIMRQTLIENMVLHPNIFSNKYGVKLLSPPGR